MLDDQILSGPDSTKFKDHRRLVTVGAVQDTDRYSTKGCRYGKAGTWYRAVGTWVRYGSVGTWVRYGRYMGMVR